MRIKLLYWAFNTVSKSNAYKLATVNSCRTAHNCIKTVNKAYFPTNQGVQYSTDQSEIATFEEVKRISKNKHREFLLVDVREPEELVETGVLPGSINIPRDLESVLRNMSSDEFFKRYGREKPHVDTPIIFSCKSGKRSATAQVISQQLGYTNVRNYLGGWLEWEERSQSK